MTSNLQHHMPSHSDRTRSWIIALLMSPVLFVTGCGGGGSSGSGTGTTVSGTTVAQTTFTDVGGTVTGLLPSESVVLQNSDGATSTLSANSAYSFSVAVGATYAVSVASQPRDQRCTVANSSGTATARVRNVAVTCSTLWTIRGTVSGLAPGTSLTLQNNGSDSLTVAYPSTTFTFANKVATGSTYAVTALNPPTDTICAVTNGNGTVANSVVSVAVTCSSSGPYNVTASVSGLISGRNLILRDNGADDLAFSASGSKSFNTPLYSGNQYAVTVATQPSGEICTPAAGASGTVNSANVLVNVSCVPRTYTVGGSVNGLGAGKSVVLQNNDSNTTTLSANGSFTFGTPVASGSLYDVTVLTQPTGQTCTISNGTGTMSTTNVASVGVTCANTVSGGGSTLRISVAGGGTVSADGAPACTNAGGSNCTPSLTTGASHTLTATPSSGYVFSGWYSNTTSAGLGTSFSPTTPYTFSKSAAAQHVTAIFTPTAANSAPPVQLYTDITSGPLTGGENNKGIYLSVFGKNLNSTGAGTTTKVYINNIEVDNYRDLAGASYRGRTDLEKVTAQLGTLGAAVNGTSLPIMVVVNGRISSNGDTALTFTPLAGNIYFVDPVNGVDTTDTSTGGTIAAPFRSAQKSGIGTSFSIQSASTSGAYGRVRAGDFIVLRGGTYSNLGFSRSFMNMLNKSGCPIGNNCSQGGGTSSGPITVMGYPGETPFINRAYSSGDSSGGAFSSADNVRQEAGYGAWWTITNVKIESGYNDGPINTQRGDLNTILGSYWRVVNNEMTATTCSLQSVCRAGGVAGDGLGNYWVGNYVHDVYDKTDGATDLENHGIYIGNEGSYVVAYNRFVNIAGGSGIQTNNNGGAAISNVKIHHNTINGVGKHGININDAITGITIFNNVVMNAKYAGLRFNSDRLSGAKVYNNSFYNTDLLNGNASVRALLINDSNWSSGAVELRNNIFAPGNGSRYFVGGNFGFSAVASGMSNNVWYSGTGTPPGSSNVTGNPLFNSTTSGAEDLHLQTGSPAIGAGTSSVSGIVVNDFDITTSRPQSSSYDIGAYER